jgi:PAS domain S-box-containing protein
VWILDAEGRTVLVNQKMADILGVTMAELIGQPPLVYVDEADRGMVLRHLEERRLGKWESYELRLRHRDGRVLWAINAASPIFDADGRVVGGLGMFTDITERKRIEQERDRLLVEERQAREAAEDAVRLRDEFLSVASHELRTPLTALQFAVQRFRLFLAKHPHLGLPEGLMNTTGTIERQVQRLTRLAGMLLDVSRTRTGRIELTVQPVDLAAIVREVADDLREEMAREHTPLTLQLPASLTGCWDRSRLEQVVINLFTNAMKFGAGKPLAVRLEAAGPVARLIVSDQGIGIAPEQQARIFERYGRAVSARHYGGLGLGLYIVHQIVEAHGGTIRVTSTPGAGSTFTVELPLAGPATV